MVIVTATVLTSFLETDSFWQATLNEWHHHNISTIITITDFHIMDEIPGPDYQ